MAGRGSVQELSLVRDRVQELFKQLQPFLLNPETDGEEWCQLVARIQEAEPPVVDEVLRLVQAMEPEIQQAIAAARNDNLRGRIRCRWQNTCKCLAPKKRVRALKKGGWHSMSEISNELAVAIGQLIAAIANNEPVGNQQAAVKAILDMGLEEAGAAVNWLDSLLQQTSEPEQTKILTEAQRILVEAFDQRYRQGIKRIVFH